jgi:hypothetical protein
MTDQELRELIKKELIRGWEMDAGRPAAEAPPDSAVDQVLAALRKWNILEELYPIVIWEIVHQMRLKALEIMKGGLS